MSQGPADTDEPVTISNDGITVEKSVSADEFPVPAVKFVLRSNAAAPVQVRLVDQIPEFLPMKRVGFHPGYHSDSWTAYKNHRVEFEHIVESGESLTTVYGIRTDDQGELQQFLGEPEIAEIASIDGDDPDLEGVLCSDSSQHIREILSGEWSSLPKSEADPLDAPVGPSESDLSTEEAQERPEGLSEDNAGITVEKSVSADDFPVSAVKFVLTSNAAAPVQVRLTDEIPESFPMEDVGFHPDFHSDSWTAYKNHRVEFEHIVESGESLTTVYGIRTNDEGELQQFLGEPEIAEIAPSDGEDPDLEGVLGPDNSQLIREVIAGERSSLSGSEADPLDAPVGSSESDLSTEEAQERPEGLSEEIDSVRDKLNDVARLTDIGEFKTAHETLIDLKSRLDSIKKQADKHNFQKLHDEITTLEERHQTRLEQVTPNLENNIISGTIPKQPDISVEYDALNHEESIGRGGNADVTKATLSTSGGAVTMAIKEPRLSGTLHSDQAERMIQEAETWVNLDDHDHIVRVYDYGSTPVPWIAVEYMDGGHLGEQPENMDTKQALWTAIAITKGVRHAHRRGVAHLDLKPENILFREVADAWNVPKVADWGLSKHLLEHSNSVEGMSVEHGAPEQFDGEYGSTDDITDVYQLGAVFYELFTGRPPFEGRKFKLIDMIKNSEPTPPSEIADVPDGLDEILLTALKKEKDDRYESVLLLRNDLQKLFDSFD